MTGNKTQKIIKENKNKETSEREIKKYYSSECGNNESVYLFIYLSVYLNISTHFFLYQKFN